MRTLPNFTQLDATVTPAELKLLRQSRSGLATQGFSGARGRGRIMGILTVVAALILVALTLGSLGTAVANWNDFGSRTAALAVLAVCFLGLGVLLFVLWRARVIRQEHIKNAVRTSKFAAENDFDFEGIGTIPSTLPSAMVEDFDRVSNRVHGISGIPFETGTLNARAEQKMSRQYLVVQLPDAEQAQNLAAGLGKDSSVASVAEIVATDSVVALTLPTRDSQSGQALQTLVTAALTRTGDVLPTIESARESHHVDRSTVAGGGAVSRDKGTFPWLALVIFGAVFILPLAALAIAIVIAIASGAS